MLFKMLLMLSTVGAMVVAHPNIKARKPILILEHNLVSLIKIKGELCVAQTGVSPATLEKLLPWQLEESELNGKFLQCIAKEMGFHQKGGRAKVDKFIDLFYETLKSQDVEEYRKLMAHCNELTGANDYFTNYKIANCFYTNAPVDFALNALVQ